ncbi:site-specific integrase [Brevundimonas vancanneytii]|uniref:Tyrosine recombinase XerD n=1 Tax=Brevundimonas vancanneytii TaxID=1325724 RepID=A0A4P1KHB1_9CAUL|nr:site-specific integrase [Brevundimonas vancanneytii]VTO19742.1 Tyrosine recombinase XerD [Brevundimonas vancanneytii]
MPKARLTQAFVANAGCEVGKKKTDWYDDTVTGFVLECRCTGGKTYYLRYIDQAGGQKQHKIGGFNDVTFAAAKKKAQQLRSEVVMGGDPSAKKALAKSIPLYSELAAKHLAFAKIHLKSYDDLESCMRVHIVPKWGKTRLTDMTSQSVSQWLNEKRVGGLAPASVEKLRVVLGRSFVLGASWDIPGTERNPTRGIPRKPLNNSRERFLTPEETVRLKAAVEASQNTQLQHIVGLLLLTGARLRELLEARWENINVERRSWFIPTSKTGKSRHVPLSTPAVAIIEKLPRFKGCPWLVPNPETRLPFVSIKHSWQHAIAEAKLPGLRLHDLRHSAASNMVNSGVDLFAVGKVLGHASYQSSQRYSHLANDTLLKAVEAGAAKQAAF